MASPATEKHSVNNADNDSTATSKSYFQKTVCLKDWWLVKAENHFEGKGLAVAGVTSREKQAVRVFSSAPILKRYDVFNLETVDGICVIIEGFMNKARTEENGFPSEVCNHFVFGFPPDWETYARKCPEGESSLMSDVQCNPDFEGLSPQAGRTGGSSKGISKNIDKAFCKAETQEHSNKGNLGIKSSSRGGKKGTKCNSNNKEAETAFDSNTHPVGPGASERETSSSVQNRKNLGLSGNHFDNIIPQPLTPTGLEETSVPSSLKANTNDTETENYGSRKCRLKILEHQSKSSPLSAYRLTKGRGCDTTVQSLEDPSTMNASKKLAERVVFSREADLSEELSNHSEGRGVTTSEKKVKGIFKDNQMFSGQLTAGRLTSVSLRGSDAVGGYRAYLDKGSSGKSALNPPGTEFQELTDEMTSRDLDARSFGDNVEQDHGISLTGKNAKDDQNHEGVQENVRMQNKTDEYMCSSYAHGNPEKRQKKIASSKQSNSQSENLASRESRRKLGLNAVGDDGANLDDRSRGKSLLTSPGTEFQELTDEMTSRKPDTRPFKDNVELDHGISLNGKDGKQDQNHEGDLENVRMPNKTDGCTCSSGAHGDTEKRKKKFASSKQNNSQSESLYSRKSKRKQSNSQRGSLLSRNSTMKLDSPVPQKRKEESSVVSPQSLNLKRSRSGRWLLPSLEFWRNQRVIYDADHQITGIKDLH